MKLNAELFLVQLEIGDDFGYIFTKQQDIPQKHVGAARPARK
jgi:hypothetical protein